MFNAVLASAQRDWAAPGLPNPINAMGSVTTRAFSALMLAGGTQAACQPYQQSSTQCYTITMTTQVLSTIQRLLMTRSAACLQQQVPDLLPLAVLPLHMLKSGKQPSVTCRHHCTISCSCSNFSTATSATFPSRRQRHSACGSTPWAMQPYLQRHFASNSSADKAASNSNDSKSAEAQAQAAESSNAQANQEEGSPEEVAAELAKRQEELAGLTQQVDKLTDQLKRALAEMENVRMRAARDVDAAKKFAVQGFVKSLLDVADNLERAAAAVPADALLEGDGGMADAAQLRKLLKGLLEGVNVTEKVMLNVFKQHGLEQYNPLGDKFDPNLHNALFEVPDASKEAGIVAAVTKRGYKLHDRVIRPADVGVVRAS